MPILRLSGTSTAEGGNYQYPQFTLDLDQPASGTIEVGYRILSGTAQYGSDVQNYSTSVIRFSAGDLTKSFSVRVNPDTFIEPDESFVVEAFVISGDATFVGGGRSDTVTSFILDDDGAADPTALYVSRPTVTEGDSGRLVANFEVSFSRPLSRDVTLDWSTVDGSAVAGEDYVGGSGTLRLIAGQQSAVIGVPVIGDRALEENEQFGLRVELPAEVGDASIGLATIIDDDGAGNLPIFSLTGTSVNEGGNYLYPGFMLTVDRPTTATLGYRIVSGTAQAGIDVQNYSTTTISFGVNDLTKTFAVRVNPDTLPEPDEAYIVEAFLISGNGAFANGANSARTTAFILDDDGYTAPLAIFVSDESVIERDGGRSMASFKAVLSRPADEAFTIKYRTVANGSATAGEDFVNQTGTIRVDIGQQEFSIGVPIKGDIEAESDEVFSLRLSSSIALEGKTTGLGTILNDGDPVPTPQADRLDYTDAGSRVNIDAGGGDDLIRGSLFDDRIIGGTGDDDLYGNRGSDRMVGGRGRDELVGDRGNDSLIGGASNDVMDGGKGRDLASGGNGNDELFGGGDRDALFGGGGNDRMSGGSGSDMMDGGSGDDSMLGGNGNDTLIGGRGDDVMTGQRGSDTFLFDGRFGDDVIRDFNPDDRREVIDLSGVDGIRNFRDLSANHMEGRRGDTSIDDGDGNTIQLNDVRMGELSASDFIF